MLRVLHIQPVRESRDKKVFIMFTEPDFHQAALLADHIDKQEGWECPEVRIGRKTGIYRVFAVCTVPGAIPKLQAELYRMAQEISGTKDA